MRDFEIFVKHAEDLLTGHPNVDSNEQRAQDAIAYAILALAAAVGFVGRSIESLKKKK